MWVKSQSRVEGVRRQCRFMPVAIFEVSEGGADRRRVGLCEKHARKVAASGARVVRAENLDGTPARRKVVRP